MRCPTLFLSVVTLAELRFGMARMPAGRRRGGLIERLEGQVLPAFAGRVLSFDPAASVGYATAMAAALMRGQTVGMADGLIAATAIAHCMTVATRDTSPFIAMGVTVIDPWLS